VVLHRSHVEIIDTWHTGGMRGTGSNDVVVDGVDVDRSATLLWSEFPPPSTAAVDRIPISASLAAGLAAQMIGVAGASLDVVVERARTAVTNGPVPDLRDRPRAQEAVARHGAAVGAARSWLYDRCGLVWRRAEAGDTCTREEVADVYGAALHAMSVATDAVDAACATAGTSSIYTSSPLERAHRDIHVMACHRLAGVAFAEDVGRIRFGLEPADRCSLCSSTVREPSIVTE
jgi:indole-3-acetate monooxygenase